MGLDDIPVNNEDNRNCLPRSKESMRGLLAFFEQKGTPCRVAEKHEDIALLIDLFLPMKSGRMASAQYKDRGRTPDDRVCVETKGEWHEGWLNKPVIEWVVFGRPGHYLFCRRDELRNVVYSEFNMDAQPLVAPRGIGPKAQEVLQERAYQDRIRWRRYDKDNPNLYSEMVYVGVGRLRQLESFRELRTRHG